MRNLVLIGFMGSGKSSVGRQCARILGFRFRDSDSLVERRAGKSITEIFAKDGEAAFRELESAAIRTLSATTNVVLSTGGGAALSPANVQALRSSGVVVLLWADPDTIVQRTSARETRPLLSGAPNPRERIELLLAEREAAYRSAAHASVDTTLLTRDETVEQVIRAYNRLAALRESSSEDIE